MDINTIDKSMLENMIRQMITEKLGANLENNSSLKKGVNGILLFQLPNMKVTEEDRMDTGKASDIVYTKDFFTLSESPRLGAGLMEIRNTIFDWTLNYDEVDYVIEGHLDIITQESTVSVDAGEVILIPKGSSIKFSVPSYAKFMYVKYPVDWVSQN